MAEKQTGASRAAQGQIESSEQSDVHYLGFDCATKTFAFCLMEVRARAYLQRRKYLRHRLLELKTWISEKPTEANEIAMLRLAVDELDRETKSMLVLVDGETKDLLPGKPDAKIHTVERLRALSQYVNERIYPAIAAHVTGPLEVVVEFQEGVNAKTRIIAPALVTLMIAHPALPKVYFVGPSLKNKLWFSEEGKYCYFSEKYAKSYDANKAHAKYNFARLESLFESKIPATRTKALRGHIADACLQCLGHLMYGDRANPEDHF